ncbi:NADP-dependent oxidoreductase [Amycolatopsis balhimycina DSM 5908]|uniref:NADP-dependent oxidoreductase n=1 Tax=Amycolatopsis balhimycina DSM 5908 TaxID=1081091 RepID=A0A428VXC9_AMYBA|nr:NADP-dependent oxidoreductase [Amycolatopsis balhimycina]RSM35520.1 NADP-dependent oxidoreductase [Amycolatopsis balhimycina DSM 5908]
MTTMKRIQYHRYGGPEVLRWEDFEPAQPGPGEVLVRVKAAAANPMDWKIRAGEMKIMTGRKFPRGLGHDFAGVVAAVGTGVTRLAAGDEVLGGAGISAAGAFAEMVVAEEKAVVKKPAELSWEEAAALPTVGLTAFQAMVGKSRLRAGQAVFIHGCLGGVGRSAAQIALAQGASVGGSCRGTAWHEARDLGISPITAFDFEASTLAGRFDVVFDTPGTLPIKAARTLLKPGGRIIDITPTPAKFLRSALPGPFRVMIGKAVTADLEAVAQAAGKRTLRLPVARTVPLGKAIAALTELERDGTPKGGKLVFTTE